MTEAGETTAEGGWLFPLRTWWRWASPSTAGRRWLLLAVVLVGAVLRITYVAEPIRFDEAANAVYYSHRTILHAVGGGAGNENHALQSTLGWFTTRLLGWGAVQFRMTALLAGILAIWIVFTVARWTIGKEDEALLAAALTAVTPWWILYSVNGRGYIYQCALVPLLFMIVVRVMRGDLGFGRLRVLGAYAGVITALGAFAVRSMLIFFVPFVVMVAAQWLRLGPRRAPADPRSRPRLVRATIWWIASTTILVGLLFTPAMLANGRFGLMGLAASLHGRWRPVVGESLSQWLRVVPRMFDDPTGWVAVLSYAVLVVGVAASRRRCLSLVAYLLLALSSSLLIAVAVGVGLYSRTLLPMGFALVLLWARGATAIVELVTPREGRVRPTARAALLVLVLGLYPAYWLSADLVNARNETGDVPEARIAATMLFDVEGWERSALVLPPLWDIPISFYALESGYEIPYVPTMDISERIHSSCDARSLILMYPEGGRPHLPDHEIVGRMTGEELMHTRFRRAHVEVSQMALSPC